MIALRLHALLRFLSDLFSVCCLSVQMRSLESVKTVSRFYFSSVDLIYKSAFLNTVSVFDILTPKSDELDSHLH